VPWVDGPAWSLKLNAVKVADESGLDLAKIFSRGQNTYRVTPRGFRH